jgi:cyclopropane fatty-acyl-phospholipid synthase-like methyltransferase
MTMPRRLIEKTYTEMHRYGHLFPAIRGLEQAFDLNFHRILSYGCSSGEECLTLAELFPDAKIYGTDANPEMTDAAAMRCAGNSRITIIPYKKFWKEKGQFDMICCMSVLFEIPYLFMPKTEWDAKMKIPAERGPALDFFAEKLSGKFPFEEFEHMVSGLDRRLKAGGLMVLQNANYRLPQTAFGANYWPVTFPGANLETMPKLSRDYRVIDQKDFTEIVFRKKPQDKPVILKGALHLIRWLIR